MAKNFWKDIGWYDSENQEVERWKPPDIWDNFHKSIFLYFIDLHLFGLFFNNFSNVLQRAFFHLQKVLDVIFIILKIELDIVMIVFPCEKVFDLLVQILYIWFLMNNYVFLENTFSVIGRSIAYVLFWIVVSMLYLLKLLLKKSKTFIFHIYEVGKLFCGELLLNVTCFIVTKFFEICFKFNRSIKSVNIKQMIQIEFF